MKRKKDVSGQKDNDRVNEYILNLIQPAGIDDSDNHASIGAMEEFMQLSSTRPL